MNLEDLWESFEPDLLPCCSWTVIAPLVLLVVLGLWGPVRGCYYLLRGGEHDDD